MSGCDAVDGSSTGTRVPRSGRRLRLPRFGGASRHSGKVIARQWFFRWRRRRHGPISAVRRRARRMGRRLLAVGLPISHVDRDTVPTDLSLHRPLLGGRTSIEAACPMIQTHRFRGLPVIVRSIIGFVAIAIALYLHLGPIGILYALGFEVLYLLIYLLYVAFASLLDPDVY